MMRDTMLSSGASRAPYGVGCCRIFRISGREGVMQKQQWVERREHAHVKVRGSAILRSAGHVVHGTAMNVSATTLEVRCDLGFALLAMAGSQVEIEMRLNGSEGSWFELSGRVRRVRAASHSLVIAIASPPAPLLAWIAEQTGRTQAPRLEVMVVDRDSGRRIQVADAFRAEGCHVTEAATPLEAFDELEGASFTTDVFAVGDTEPDDIGIDLRNHLDRAYVDALVVAVGLPEWTPTRIRLAPSNIEGLLRGNVRSVMMAHAEAPLLAGAHAA